MKNMKNSVAIIYYGSVVLLFISAAWIASHFGRSWVAGGIIWFLTICTLLVQGMCRMSDVGNQHDDDRSN